MPSQLYRSHRTILCLALASSAVPVMGQVKAFEGAEGFGAYAKGARTNLASATVYHVTNLNDSGAGSFRDAVSQGNRFIVFDVGGIITLNSGLAISQDNLTIAGQTAPGGIVLYGDKVSFSSADNLIARHFAIRKGEAGTREDASGLANGANMIFDHMSITWGVDETFSMNWDGKGNSIDNITIQNSIIAQGQDRLGHSAGGLMTLPAGGRFSIIKSLFADSVTRNPKVRGENEFINNVVYGWETAAYIMGDTVNQDSHANVIGNTFIEGPVNGGAPFTSGTPNFYIYGADNWVDADRDGVFDPTPITTYSGGTVMPSPFAFPTQTALSAQAGLEYVLNHVGPSITRDAVDSRIVEEVRSYGTLGGVIQRETDLFPGYGTDPKYLNPRAKLTDADNDGMADNWELAHGLNPADGADWKALNAGGYTRLEEYVNELGSDGFIRVSTGGTWTSAATWGGTIPTLADDAVVDGSVSHGSGQAFARKATIAGALAVSGGTFDVFDTLAINGNVTLTGGATTVGRLLLASPGQNATLSLKSGATLQTGSLASGGGTANFDWDGGTLRTTGGAAVIALPTTVGTNGGTIDTGANTTTYTGKISGAGAITKVGTGALVLSGNNDFAGGVNLTGSLKLAHSNGAGTGQINVSSNGGIIHLANGVNVGNAIRTSYGFEILDIVDANATATFSGSIAPVSNQQIRINTTGTNTLLNITGSVSAPNGFLFRTGQIQLLGNGSVIGTSGAVGRGQTAATTLTLRDSSTFALTSGFSMGGGSSLASGTITVRENATLSSGENGIDLLNTTTATSSGTINLLGGKVVTSGFTKTSVGATHMANLNFNGGLLQYSKTTGSSAFLPALAGLTARVQGGGARIDDNGQAITIAQAMIHDAALGTTADGGLTKTGAGTLTLSGNNTYTGLTSVNAGTLVITGTHTGGGAYMVGNGARLGGTGVITGAVGVQAGGTLAPGLSPGTLSTGSLTLGMGANLAVEVNSFSPSGFDVVNVTGTVDLGAGANLQLALNPGYTPKMGDSVTFIVNDGADAVVGAFGSLNGVGPILPNLFLLPTAGGDLAVELSYTAGGNDVSLTVIPEPSGVAALGVTGGVAGVMLGRRRR